MRRMGAGAQPAFSGSPSGQRQRWSRVASSISGWETLVCLYREEACVLRQHVAPLRVEVEGGGADSCNREE